MTDPEKIPSSVNCLSLLNDFQINYTESLKEADIRPLIESESSREVDDEGANQESLWLAKVQRIKNELGDNINLNNNRRFAFAAMLHWMIERKAEPISLPRNDLEVAHTTIDLSNNPKFIQNGKRGGVVRSGSKAIKFFYRPWGSVAIDEGTSPWQIGVGEVAVLNILKDSELPAPVIDSWGWVDSQKWPHWRYAKGADDEGRKLNWEKSSYHTQNQDKMDIGERVGKDSEVAIVMSDLGELSKITSSDPDYSKAEGLFHEMKTLLAKHGLVVLDAHVDKTIMRKEDGSLAIIDFSHVMPLNSDGLRLLLSYLPPSSYRDACLAWHEDIRLPANDSIPHDPV